MSIIFNLNKMKFYLHHQSDGTNKNKKKKTNIINIKFKINLEKINYTISILCIGTCLMNRAWIEIYIITHDLII